MLQQILYLCFVGRRKIIFFKQLIAGFLLSVLSVITIIQVSHSHSSLSTNQGQQKNFIKRSVLPGYNTASVESKCFICEYQLAKDIDINFFVVAIEPSVYPSVITEANYSFTFQRISSFVETRGPPYISWCLLLLDRLLIQYLFTFINHYFLITTAVVLLLQIVQIIHYETFYIFCYIDLVFKHQCVCQ